MNRFFNKLLRELYPDEFPGPECSPELKAKQIERGRGLARYKPWARGRIGALGHRVRGALIHAQLKGIGPVTTGWLVREIYLGIGGRKSRFLDKDAPPPKIERWMYGNVRKAAETYAVRIGRGVGHGSPILWQLKEDGAVYSDVIRKRKAAEYVRRKRKAEQRKA
jgi:hypothetical protein